MAWDPDKFTLHPFFCYGGILLTCTNRATIFWINLLNIYGLCTDRQFFWEQIEAGGLLNLKT